MNPEVDGPARPVWDGRGLPPVVQERVRRAASGGPWTSLLSVPARPGSGQPGWCPSAR
jgi:hypothetical protein